MKATVGRKKLAAGDPFKTKYPRVQIDHAGGVSRHAFVTVLAWVSWLTIVAISGLHIAKFHQL